MISKPLAFDDIDPNQDFVKAVGRDSDSDDVHIQGLLSEVGGLSPGEIWYIHAKITTSTESYNEGVLAVSNSTYQPDGEVSWLMQRTENGSQGARALEGYITYGDTNGLDVNVSAWFDEAAISEFSWLMLEAEAIKMRRGHDLTPTAFGPNQNVQSYDATEAPDATFSPASIAESGFARLDLDEDNRHDAVTYTAEIPEYTADNPILSFDVRRISGVETDWPDYWQTLEARGALPQSSNVDSSDWPIYGQIAEDTEVPAPYRDPGDEEIARTYYEVRPVLWEANQRDLTETTGAAYEFNLADGG